MFKSCSGPDLSRTPLVFAGLHRDKKGANDTTTTVEKTILKCLPPTDLVCLVGLPLPHAK
jgi:hypothetical protein